MNSRVVVYSGGEKLVEVNVVIAGKHILLAGIASNLISVLIARLRQEHFVCGEYLKVFDAKFIYSTCDGEKTSVTKLCCERFLTRQLEMKQQQ